MSTVEGSATEEVVSEEVQKGEPNAWWTTLKHDGVLLSPPVLEEVFSGGPPEVSGSQVERLRRKYLKFKNNPDKLRDWLDTVLESFLGHSQNRWEKESFVSDEFKFQNLRPNRVLKNGDGSPRLAVWIDDDRVTTDDGEPGRIGIYRGRRTYAKLVKLLRSTEIPLGVLTNGHQFRIVHATLDRDSWSEWGARAWFEGGEGREAMRGFYGLLGSEGLLDEERDEEDSLLGKIKESRERQADLSDVMGTQVREAVELLIQELDAILMEVDEAERADILKPLKELDLSQRGELQARYQASIRMIMRLVVALYAESRGLFPKDNPVYYKSYSVEGLFRELRKARIEQSEDILKNQYSGWPRLLALSQLVYYGSPHPKISIQSYGGKLFRPPEEDGEDSVLAALSVFGHKKVRISDATLLKILEKLKIAEFKAGGEKRRGPVDFSELRTEYIGMMYEGLLGYDLREATEKDGAIVFLNVGDEPALPFNVLESLDNDGIDNLIDNLKDRSSDSFLSEEEVSESDFEEEEFKEEESEENALPEIKVEEDADIDARVHAWARRVVRTTGVYMPHHNTVRAMDPTIREKYAEKAARRLIDRVIRPGGTYLVSWKGTRKSTGTFYTPPRLAVPTVHRTLEPLAYEVEGEKEKVPKFPEEILDLKICDSAMGSGTFLVAATEYMTDALKESFELHVLPEVNEGEPIAEPFGEQAKGILNERLLAIRRGEDEQWEERLEAQLKRLIVERCIYGVDINPLAVELGKLSLWIETMNPELPFTFLDHKLRVGNSLIGAWLDEFQHYPVAAWNRDGANDERDKRIRNFRNNEMKEQMRNYIKRSQHRTYFFEEGPDIESLIESARENFEDIHESAQESERERLYQEEFMENEDVQTLRHLMDRWCAIWFWPMDSDENPVLDPETFYDSIYDAETESIVEKLANKRKLKFFHWELEFPDVFLGDEWGFDAVLGNPPWDKEKPNSLEFFTRYRPEFKTYGKQEARRVRKELFGNQPQIEKDWWDNVSFYRGLSNYISYSSNPWDVPLARGKKSTEMANEWRKIRQKNVSSIKSHPFSHQGSADLNSYKMFAEKFHYLTRSGGRVGAIFPSGIYSDYGNQELRELFLERSYWEWIYSFENRKGIFPDIDNRYKFSANVITKSPKTKKIKSRFMVHDLDEWNREKEPEHILITRKQIEKFSPNVLGIMEVKNQKDIEILNKIYDSSELIKDLDVQYDREFDMTNDSELFYEEEDLEEKGFELDENGIFYQKGDPVALPLLEGRHLDCFDYQANKHIRGHGRTAEWEKLDWDEKVLSSRYWLLTDDLLRYPEVFEKKVCFINVTSASNKRTIRASVVPPYPCGNSVPVLRYLSGDAKKHMIMAAIMNSYALDFAARFKIQGVNANWYLVKTFPFPKLNDETREKIINLSRRLHSPVPQAVIYENRLELNFPTSETVRDKTERAKIREELDAIVAEAYGLSDEDMKYILRSDNNDPRNLWKDYKERLKLLGGEGKWGKLPKEEIEKLEEEEVYAK